MSTILKALQRLEEEKNDANEKAPLRDDLPPVAPKNPSSPPTGRPWLKPAVLAAVGILLVGGMIWWLRPGGEVSPEIPTSARLRPAPVRVAADTGSEAEPPPAVVRSEPAHEEPVEASPEAASREPITAALAPPPPGPAESVQTARPAPSPPPVRSEAKAAPPPRAPAAKPAEPVVEPERVAAKPAEPVAKPERVAAKPAEPGVESKRVPEKPAPVAAPPPSAPPKTRPVARSRPKVGVARTVWHPDASRRRAMVEVPQRAGTILLAEGDAVGTLVVLHIEPSAVVFLHGDRKLRREVGTRP